MIDPDSAEMVEGFVKFVVVGQDGKLCQHLKVDCQWYLSGESVDDVERYLEGLFIKLLRVNVSETI